MNKKAAIVESDCLMAIQAIRSNCVLVLCFGRVIQECKRLSEELRGK